MLIQMAMQVSAIIHTLLCYNELKTPEESIYDDKSHVSYFIGQISMDSLQYTKQPQQVM